MIREGQCTRLEVYNPVFLYSALFCFEVSLVVCPIIIRNNLMFRKESDSINILGVFGLFVLKDGEGERPLRAVGMESGQSVMGDRGSRGPCRLRTLAGTVEAEALRSGRKGDACCPAAACSYFVNVTREDVVSLYFSMI